MSQQKAIADYLQKLTKRAATWRPGSGLNSSSVVPCGNGWAIAPTTATGWMSGCDKNAASN
jgi:hypothetical protein